MLDLVGMGETFLPLRVQIQELGRFCISKELLFALVVESLGSLRVGYRRLFRAVAVCCAGVKHGITFATVITFGPSFLNGIHRYRHFVRKHSKERDHNLFKRCTNLVLRTRPYQLATGTLDGWAKIDNWGIPACY